MRVACAARPASDFRRLAETVLSGERRLPACIRQQLADEIVFGKLPNTAGKLPALPEVKETGSASLIRQVHRHAMTSRKVIHQSANPFGETSQIGHQISRETGKGNLRRCDHEQSAQKQQVDHINKNEGKKCPVIAQIGLVFRNHPTGEGEVKGPGNPQNRVEELAVGGDVEE